MTDEERDTLNHLREQRDGLEKQVATLRAELAAERERARSAERREGNLRDHIVHLGMRVATLREALEPFAVAAENFDSFPIKDAEQWFAYSGVSSQKDNGEGAITVGDLRRARAVLKERGGDHGAE
jgi:predicted nuclease with TOPRIM domain